MCDISVSGGYDPEMNQVVVCQNIARGEGMVQGVLLHEMIHMFDYCNNNLDFKNIDHLACTEIRAANLSHCSFLSAWAQGDASPFKIQQAHQVCFHQRYYTSGSIIYWPTCILNVYANFVFVDAKLITNKFHAHGKIK